MKKTLLILLTIFSSFYCKAQNFDKSIIDSLTNYLKQKHIPGAMISIVSADTILFVGGIGYADIDKKEKVTAEHLFRQGSISKSFTALGLVKLFGQKGMFLNTPIHKIDSNIPFTNAWKSESPITVEHLLEHTTGFDEFHFKAIYNKTDTEEPPTINMVNAHKNSLTSRWKPGTYKAYSNVNYIVAGQILETVAEEPYYQYIKNHILSPLKMYKSGYYFTEPTCLNIAQGYRYNGKSYDEVKFAHIQGGPAGSFCTNAGEMAYFLQFMLKKKLTILDSLNFTTLLFDRIEKSETNIAAKNGLPYGYGLGNYSIWKNGYLFHGHGGGIDGFSSRYVYSRDADIGVAVAINREGNANAIVDEILKYILGTRTNPPRNRKVLPIPLEIKEKYAGFYEFISPRHKLLAFTDRMLASLILDFEEDKIITRSFLGKGRDTLRYAGNNLFYKNNEGVPSTMFLESENGEPAFWINENFTLKKSHTKRLIINFAVFISLVLPFIFLIYLTIRFVAILFRKKKKPLKNVLFLSLACLSYVVMFGAFAMIMNNRETAGDFSFKAVLLYISSILLIIFSLLSIYKYFELTQKRGFKRYYALTTLAVLILSIFFWDNGFIGLKLWAY